MEKIEKNGKCEKIDEGGGIGKISQMTKMFKMTFSSPQLVKIAEIAIFKVLEQKHCFTDFMPPKNPKKRDQILSKSDPVGL